MTFVAVHWRQITLLIVAAAAVVAMNTAYGLSLREAQFLSGWLLLAAVVFLALYNVRKKLRMLPLGSNTAWLGAHLFVGWLSILLFGLHIEWRLPNGWLESALALVYVLVAASGVLGLILSRTLAKRLTPRGEEVIFERIPEFRAKLQAQARELALDAARETDSSTISDWYLAHLADFFAGHRHFRHHLVASNRPLFGLLRQLDEMGRYLNETEKELAAPLRELVIKKYNLDFHYALQGTLKAWLFVHVPFSYALLILAVPHMVLAYAFSGGW